MQHLEKETLELIQKTKEKRKQIIQDLKKSRKNKSVNIAHKKAS
jgi:hypothetical protein